jgi:2,4-dienoyl-CoA reductase-like NADH-dependent reductase (Old Yellow Enzyme family)
MSNLFQPLNLRGVTIRNRIALSPMCMYSCDAEDGLPTSWHLPHLASRAAGGCGLIMTEATAITPGGVISPQDLGIYTNEHVTRLKQITDTLHSLGATSGTQLAHAGRKAGTYRPWSTSRGYIPDWPHPRHAPSAIPFSESSPAPTELSKAEIQTVIEQFTEATRRADQAGFQIIELHSAHGYLMHEFLSPISNQRTDEYGGSFENRIRFHHELFEAVRPALNADKPLFMRISATDWVEGGWTIEDSIALCKSLKPLGLDFVDCSTGGNVPKADIQVGLGYQVQFAEAIKTEAQIPTGAVGMITNANQAEAIIAGGRADMVFIGREMLRNPYWAIDAAIALGEHPTRPAQYEWALNR